MGLSRVEGAFVSMTGQRAYIGHGYWERALRPWVGNQVSVAFEVSGRIETARGVLTGLGNDGPELDSSPRCRWEDIVSVEEAGGG